jgi:hypothetical protein
MSNVFGWDLPPGVSDKMIDESIGSRSDEQEPDEYNGYLQHIAQINDALYELNRLRDAPLSARLAIAAIADAVQFLLHESALSSAR